jgi:predicted nucleic acid-binding protein
MESRPIVIDSSVFVALYCESDTQHTKAVQIMNDLKGSTIVVHPYVVQESATVLAYRFGAKLAKAFVADIKNAPNIHIPAVDLKRDIDHFTLQKKKMSFTDSTLIGLAQSMNAILLTFDRQMLSSLKAKK